MAEMPLIEYKKMFQTEDELWWYQSLRRVISAFLRKNIKSGSKVLDAGCGTGRNSLLMQELGYNVISVDVSTAAVNFCNKRGLQKVSQQSITKLSFAKNTFDAVVCCDVLGSLTAAQRQAAIRELERVLKPHGELIIQVAAVPWLQSVHDEHVGFHYRYTRQSLQHLIKHSQLSIKYCTYRYFLVFPLVCVVKILKKMRRSQSQESDMYLPSPFINNSLNFLMKCEDTLWGKVDWPIGSSLVMVLEKKLG